MSTQQQEHEIPQKAQAPTPVKEHRWLVVLLSILGVAVPLIAGWWLEGPWPKLDIFPTNDWFLPMVVMVVVPVAVGAFLLCFAFRAWWVAVFAGLAWYVGEVLGAAVVTIVEGRTSELLAWGFWSLYIGTIGSIAVLPILIGMALGVGIALPLIYLRERGLSRQ